MNQEPRTLATVRTYDQLLAVMRARSDEMEITRETADADGGLQSGYSAKLLSPRPIKRLGRMSLGALLGVLRLALVVVEDSSTTRPSPDRRKRRLARKVR